MDLEKIKTIIRRKPLFFLLISLGYLVLIALLKWQIHPTWGTLWFLAGGAIGVYFLDIAEVFFNLNPSPFRSMLFVFAFILVGLFVVTSSGSMIASGLVLSLYFTLALWQTGEWNVKHNLHSWYRMIVAPVSIQVQQWVLWVVIGVFILETFLFVR